MAGILPHYQRVLEVIAELDGQSKIHRVLEIGCGSVNFPKELRRRGYDAHGLDASGEGLDAEGITEGYLHHNYIFEIPNHFQEGFDLIFAHRVMSKAAVLALLSYHSGDTGRDILRFHKGGIEGAVEEVAKSNNDVLLRSVSQKLNPSGYFLATETDKDEIYVLPEQIKRVGLQVVRFQPQEMLLRR